MRIKVVIVGCIITDEEELILQTPESFWDDCYNFSGGYRFYDMVKRGKEQSATTYPCGMSK